MGTKHTCILLLRVALPNSICFCESYTTRFLHPVIFFCCLISFSWTRSAHTSVLVIAALLNFIFLRHMKYVCIFEIHDCYTRRLEQPLKFFCFVFMGSKRTYMFFSDPSITEFHVFLRSLRKKVAEFNIHSISLISIINKQDFSFFLTKIITLLFLQCFWSCLTYS